MNNMIPFPAPPRMARQTQQGQQRQPRQGGPMKMIMDRFMNGMNPEAILDQMGGPQARQAKQIIHGKSPAQLRGIAMNMAQQRGVNLGELAQQLGVRLPE